MSGVFQDKNSKGMKKKLFIAAAFALTAAALPAQRVQRDIKVWDFSRDSVE